MEGARPARAPADGAVRRPAVWVFAIRLLRHRDPPPRRAVAVAAGGHVDDIHLRDLSRRRGRHIAELAIRLIVLAVAVLLIYYGYVNFLRGFGSFRLPSNTPIASLYAAIPISGALIFLFTVEQIVNGCRNGFDHPEFDTTPDSGVFGATRPDGTPQCARRSSSRSCRRASSRSAISACRCRSR